MKKLLTKTTCLLLLLVLVFSSCKKDNLDQPTAQYLQVSLNDYLPAAKIDSAIVIWEVNGVKQTVKMTLENNQFRMPLATLHNNGNGTLSIQLYSQVKVDNKPLQWEYRVPYTLERTQAVTIAAPIGINDPAWNPRAIFHYDNSMGSRFSALVALRPEDAYFELKGVEPVYAKRIEIMRSFHQRATGAVVYSREWVGQHTSLDNKGNLVDRQYFLNLREQIGQQDWNQYRIRASFHLNSNPASVYEFNLAQDRL